MGRKAWVVGKFNKEYASKIAESFSIDPFAALLMSERNLDNDSKISVFLGKNTDLSDPFSLPDMQKAVDRINDAIFNFEKICIYGDYDADGVTATALLYSYLEAQGANVTYLLPDRKTDGYGLSNNIVDKIKSLGTSLLVTVDNGIAAVSEAKYIQELGMELIVTDHHLPGKDIPECVAVVDPHRTDAMCSYKDYSGVGVAMMFAAAVEGDAEAILYDFAELVAIGTVADMVPLTGENRALVKRGLTAMNSYPHPGTQALIEACALKNNTVTSSSISFALAPRINAAGRIKNAEKALELLLCEEPETAREIALELNAINETRHETENQILCECEKFIADNPKVILNPILVVYGHDWHEGVLGIVASKLLEKYLKPAVVLSISGEIATGSARSVPGFSIYDAFFASKDYIHHFGGHNQAAGLTVELQNIEVFAQTINKYAYSVLTEEMYPRLFIDCKLNSESLSLDILDSMTVLEPFGSDNFNPTFGLFDMVIDNVTSLGDRGQHLRITTHKSDKNTSLQMMKFNVAPGSFPYKSGDKVDFAVTLDRNVWNNTVKLSILVKDIRPTNVDDKEMAKSEQLFDKIMLNLPLSNEEALFALPDRALFANVYTYLKHSNGLSVDSYEYLFSKTGSNNDNLCRVRVAVLALISLELITISDDRCISIRDSKEKVDLLSAPVLKYINDFIDRG